MRGVIWLSLFSGLVFTWNQLYIEYKEQLPFTECLHGARNFNNLFNKHLNSINYVSGTVLSTLQILTMTAMRYELLSFPLHR